MCEKCVSKEVRIDEEIIDEIEIFLNKEGLWCGNYKEKLKDISIDIKKIAIDINILQSFIDGIDYGLSIPRYREPKEYAVERKMHKQSVLRRFREVIKELNS